tara:strand:+ start:71 stop:436 length:366 start_codon:yes stop_codon:yes gene_type:complete
MGYYIGLNTGDLEDTVENYVLKNILYDDLDLWEQNGWGFFEELGMITLGYENIFTNLDLDGITTIINSNNLNINKFTNLCIEHGNVFFNETHDEINSDVWLDSLKVSRDFTISICECEPEG